MIVRSRRTVVLVALCLTAALSCAYLKDVFTRLFDPQTPRSLLVTKTPQPAHINLEPPIPDHHNEGPAQKPLAKLRYRADGLVEVSEDGPHPIYELIARAEKAWNEKLKKASRTLEEAVIEYRRRYHREPPLGFDKW